MVKARNSHLQVKQSPHWYLMKLWLRTFKGHDHENDYEKAKAKRHKLHRWKPMNNAVSWFRLKLLYWYNAGIKRALPCVTHGRVFESYWKSRTDFLRQACRRVSEKPLKTKHNLHSLHWTIYSVSSSWCSRRILCIKYICSHNVTAVLDKTHDSAPTSGLAET